MFQADPRLTENDLQVVSMTLRYLHDCVPGGTDVAVVPLGADGRGAAVQVIYEAKTEANNWLQNQSGLNAELILTKSASVAIRLDLYEAMRISVAVLAGGLLSQVDAVSNEESVDDLSSRLDIGLESYFKPEVKSWNQGTFVSPEESGFVCYYVDGKGHLIPRARAASVKPILFYLAAKRQFRQKGLQQAILDYDEASSR